MNTHMMMLWGFTPRLALLVAAIDLWIRGGKKKDNNKNSSY